MFYLRMGHPVALSELGNKTTERQPPLFVDVLQVSAFFKVINRRDNEGVRDVTSVYKKRRLS